MQPLVSIIVPTYKRPEALQRAIESVKLQTFESWQLIIVDDNAPSSEYRELTAQVIKHYQSDPRIYYIQHAQNEGACKARNTGWQHSTAKYIAFLDDDDVWRTTKLEKQISLLEQSNAALCYSDMHREYRGREQYLKCLPSDDFLQRLLTQGFGVCTSAIIISREALIAINGFDNSLPSLQDFDLLVRVAQNYRCVHLPEALLIYHLGDDGITCNANAKSLGHKKIIEKHYQLYLSLDLQWGLSRQYESLADYELRSGNRKSAMSNYIQALTYKKNNPRVMVKLVFGAVLGKFPLEAYLKNRQHLLTKIK